MKAFIAAAFAVVGIVLSPFAVAGTKEEPPLKTETALACLLGMAPDGCENGFIGVAVGLSQHLVPRFEVRRLITYCAQRYIHRRLDNCYSGPLESVKYLGTNAAGDDVYDVKYQHMDKTYVIAQPAVDGSISSLWIIEGPAIQSNRRAVVTVTSPDSLAQTLYRRPPQYAELF